MAMAHVTPMCNVRKFTFVAGDEYYEGRSDNGLVTWAKCAITSSPKTDHVL